MILMDIKMPVMSGFEATIEIKGIGRNSDNCPDRLFIPGRNCQMQRSRL